MLGYDYSAGPIAPAVLKALGCSVVFRYVSTPGNPKNISRSEYEALTAAGIVVGLVYETTADWMLGGYNAGLTAAASAREQATAVGYPATHPIWYAADLDTAARTGSLTTIVDALHGCADAEGSKTLVRPYGDFDVIEAAYGSGFTGAWQTVAWSGGLWSAYALVRQTGQTDSAGGVQVDVDETFGPLFPPPVPVPPAPVHHQLEEDDMILYTAPESGAADAPKDVFAFGNGKYEHVADPAIYKDLLGLGWENGGEINYPTHAFLLAAYGGTAVTG